MIFHFVPPKKKIKPHFFLFIFRIDAAFVGDRLNTEANEFNNLLTLKKKRIPKTKGKNLIQKSGDNNTNKTDVVLNKKSEVKLTITNYRKRVRRSKTEALNESKRTHKKNIAIKAKTEVTVSIKHDKNKEKLENE